MKRGVLACGQEAAGGYLDLGGLPPAFCWRGSPRRRPRSETAAQRGAHTGKRTIATAANNSLCLRPLVARHTLSLSDFQSEFLHFSFRRQQKEAVGCYARGEPMYFQNKIQLSESAWMAGGCRNDRRGNGGQEAGSSAQTGAEGSPPRSSFGKPRFPSNTLHISSDWKSTKPPPASAMEIYCELEGVVWS